MSEEILRIKGLTKSFGGVRAVNGCTFAVRKGMVTALIGPNGAGKTTVFNLISGFVTQDSGNLEFRGERIEHMPAWQRARRGIARTFQQVRLFQNLSLEDNLAAAAEREDEGLWRSIFKFPSRHPEAATEGSRPPACAQHAGKKAASDASPATDRVWRGGLDSSHTLGMTLRDIGIDRPLSALASELSFGQQKLLEFARAQIFPHMLLLLDEPVAGVAPHLRQKITETIQALRRQGETILLIEHDMEFVMQIADRVIVMDEGSVLMQGTPEEVRSHPQVLEAYLGEQL